jgi:hypothetical protein
MLQKVEAIIIRSGRVQLERVIKTKNAGLPAFMLFNLNIKNLTYKLIHITFFNKL